MEYYKITNKKENHYEFQYKNGLNVLIEPFDDDPDHSCCAGGLYFTDIQNILKFAKTGCYLREVLLPTNDPDFKMIGDENHDIWRANKIILGKRYVLYTIETVELLKKGLDVKHFEELLPVACVKGNYNLVKYLIDTNLLDSSTWLYERSICYACGCSYIDQTFNRHERYEIIKLLVEKKKIYNKGYQCTLPFYYACLRFNDGITSNYRLLAFLIENCIDIFPIDNIGIKNACAKRNYKFIRSFRLILADSELMDLILENITAIDFEKPESLYLTAKINKKFSCIQW